LGLWAGLATRLGSAGPLDYALHSARSLRDSLAVVRRYAKLYSDAFEPDVTVEHDRAVVRLGSKLSEPRAISDFVLSTCFLNHLRPHLDETADIRCWFNYERPGDVTLHRRVFAGTELNFGAKFSGFSFNAAFLDRELASASSVLHALHCRYLETLCPSVVDPTSFAVSVRALITTEIELSQARLSETSTARKLNMSRRTLVRRLAAEHTSFNHEADEVRRDRALSLIRMRTLSVGKIASLVGFAQVQAFHRAFKRWTGQTPMKYRMASEPLDAMSSGTWGEVTYDRGDHAVGLKR
jgi:AraC-like DNA-binding protein